MTTVARLVAAGEPTKGSALATPAAQPYETTPSGQRLFRRQQLEVIGNARLSRRWSAS
jgi:hypothetical protein